MSLKFNEIYNIFITNYFPATNNTGRTVEVSGDITTTIVKTTTCAKYMVYSIIHPTRENMFKIRTENLPRIYKNWRLKLHIGILT